jgi:hypothetical protein
MPCRSAAGRDADTQFIVFDSSLVGVMPLAASDPMHIKYRAQFEQCVRARRAAAECVLPQPSPGARVRAEPWDPNAPYPGNGALQSVLATLIRPCSIPRA